MRRISWAAIGAGIVLACAACEGDDTETPATTDAAVEADGMARPGDVFSEGLTKMGTSGRLQLRLEAADPAPPLRGENAWTIDVLDEAGAPQAGCTFEITARMPVHNHGSRPPDVEALGEGRYDLRVIDFFMPGLWEVTLTPTCGEATDSAVFSFWIEG